MRRRFDPGHGVTQEVAHVETFFEQRGTGRALIQVCARLVRGRRVQLTAQVSVQTPTNVPARASPYVG